MRNLKKENVQPVNVEPNCIFNKNTEESNNVSLILTDSITLQNDENLTKSDF